MKAPELLRLIDKRLAELGISASEASTRAVGNHYLIRNMHRRAGMPSVENLQAVCDVLGMEFYIGPLRESPTAAPSAPTGAADAIRQRFSGEALRKEIHTLRDTAIAMHEEIARREAGTEAALKELTSLLSPQVQGLKDDSGQRSPAGGKVLPFPSSGSADDGEYDSVRRYKPDDIRIAAGQIAFVDREPVPGEVKFRHDWLESHGLEAKNLMLLDVTGDSMVPTIEESDSVLIDESHRKPRSGRIYSVVTTDGPLVKRLRKRGGRWWAESDNDKYEPRPLGEEDRTLGRVVWWAHTEG